MTKAGAARATDGLVIYEGGGDDGCAPAAIDGSAQAAAAAATSTRAGSAAVLTRTAEGLIILEGAAADTEWPKVVNGSAIRGLIILEGAAADIQRDANIAADGSAAIRGLIILENAATDVQREARAAGDGSAEAAESGPVLEGDVRDAKVAARCRENAAGAHAADEVQGWPVTHDFQVAKDNDGPRVQVDRAILGEGNGVGAAGAVGIANGLAQRARAAVVEVGDQKE